MTAILAVVLWLGRKLIATRLTKSVQHEFDTKLESLRTELRKKEELLKADLRSKEAEIAALRGGAMTAMASRQVALDSRRLEAVDQLWAAVTALVPARIISSFVTVFKFKEVAEETSRNAKLREMFAMVGSGFDPKKLDLSSSAKARPFVSPMAWALFSAYRAIAMQAVAKLEIIKLGIGAKDILDKDAIAKLVKAALPHHEAYIDKFGDAAYHYLLDELETRLLDELQKMLAGVEADRASVEQAAEILRRSNELMDSAKQGGMPPNNGVQPTSASA